MAGSLYFRQKFEIRHFCQAVLNCSFNRADCDSQTQKQCYHDLRSGYLASEEYAAKSNEVCPPDCKQIRTQCSSYSIPLDTVVMHQHNMLEAMATNDTLTKKDLFESQDYNSSATILTRIKIYMESSNMEVVTEHLKYKPLDFLGNMGGIIGLTVGMSLFSLFQWVELLFDLILCGLRCNPNNVIDSDNKDEERPTFDIRLPAAAVAKFPPSMQFQKY